MNLNAGNRDIGASLLARARIYLSILIIIASGPVIIGLIPNYNYLKEFAQRFGSFLLVLALWELLLLFIIKFVFKNSFKKNKLGFSLAFIGAFLLSTISLYFAGHLEDKITHTFFAILLVSLGFRAISKGFDLVGYKAYAFLSFLVYLLGISNFSSALTAADWDWPLILIGLAMQSGLHAQFFLGLLEQSVANKDQKSIMLNSRLHAVALLLGPGIICFLQYFGFFPKSYLICLIPLALTLRSADLSRSLEKSQILKAKEAKTCLIKVEGLSVCSTVLFLLCLLIAPYISL